ncbi:hypothetical protein L1887_54385 [Cichorium endivia]|nr:hypothetical protein L1887_54385 [Cichorium endivia]
MGRSVSMMTEYRCATMRLRLWTTTGSTSVPFSLDDGHVVTIDGEAEGCHGACIDDAHCAPRLVGRNSEVVGPTCRVAGQRCRCGLAALITAWRTCLGLCNGGVR